MEVETAYLFIAAAIRSVEADVDMRAQELFGDNDYCTDEEFDIIFDDGLTHAQKVAALLHIRSRTVSN